jgi:hypothetical protein
MQQQALRLRDRAQASALSKSKTTAGWNQTPELVNPLPSVQLERLFQWLQACSPPERQFYSTGATLLVSSFWMMASSSMTTTSLPLELIMDIISCLTRVLSAADPSFTSVAQRKVKDSDVEILRLKCARSMALSLWTAATRLAPHCSSNNNNQQHASNNRHVSHDTVAL